MNRQGQWDPRFDDLAAYALNALDADEMRKVEDLLARSEEARMELAELQEAASAFSAATPDVEPSVGLRERIIAGTLETEWRHAPASATFGGVLGGKATPARVGFAVSSLALAAALIVAVIFGVQTSRLQDDLDRVARDVEQGRTELADVQARVTAISGELVSASTKASEQSQQVSRLGEANSALQQAIRDQQWITYVTYNRNWETPSWFRDENSAAPSAQGQIVMSPTGDSAILFVDGLPQLPEGWLYRLWLTGAGWRWDAASFGVDDSGYARVSMSGIPDGVKYFTGAAITRAQVTDPASNIEVISAPATR